MNINTSAAQGPTPPQRPSPRKSSTYLIEGVLLFVAIVWGVNPVAIKIGMQYLPPETFNLARMIIASF